MRERLTLAEFDELTVDTLKGVGPKKAEALDALGVHTLLDLLTYYPRRWLDRTRQAAIADLELGEEATLLVTVEKVSARRTRNRRTIVEVRVSDGTGSLTVPYFNQPWMERKFRPGMELVLFGRMDTYRDPASLRGPGHRRAPPTRARGRPRLRRSGAGLPRHPPARSAR
jgi:ATP-dependent DNA helicase RecG